MPPTAERSTLLYVEDNRDNWEVTELMLKRRFDLIWAKTDEEACKMLVAHANKISAVLMDIELQGSRLSGIDLTKLIRGVLKTDALPEYAKAVKPSRSLPIIFVTGYGAKYTEDELIAFGGNRGLNKPVNFGELSIALSQLAVHAQAGQEKGGEKRGEQGIARLLVDNPRFHTHLKGLAEAGLFAPRGYAGDFGLLVSTLDKSGLDAAAMAVSVLDLLRSPNDAMRFFATTVCRRAIACQLVAQRTALVDVQRATATGFLLDAGLVVRAMHDPAGALEIGMAPAMSRPARERAGNEVEHPERILDIARSWDLPLDVTEAVRHHHDAEPPAEPLSRVAWVAERLAGVFETGDVVANNSAAIASAGVVGLMHKDFEAILEELPERVRILGESTSLGIGTQIPYRTLLSQANPQLSLLARAYRELEQSSEALVAEKHGLAERLSRASEGVAAAHRKDMALIAAVQSMYLPRMSRLRVGRAELSAFYRSADDCGGDWWWYDEDDERLRVFIGDVSGHGAGSAMVTGSIASTVRLARRMSPTMPAQALLEMLHGELWAMAHGDYHMTMLVVEVPRNGSTVQLYSAAAPHVLAMNSEGKVSVSVTRGTPLGMPTDRFTVGRAEFLGPSGTRIMAFTDGLYEFHGPNGQEVGVKTLRKLLGDTHGYSLDDASRRIVRELDVLHPADVAQEDDMTFVMLDIVA